MGPRVRWGVASGSRGEEGSNQWRGVNKRSSIKDCDYTIHSPDPHPTLYKNHNNPEPD